MNSELLSEDKKEKEEWSKSITKGGVTKRINVEELDNGGYLICFNQYGKGEDGEYKDINKKFYSKTNPLEDEEPVKKESQELTTILDIINAPTQLL